MSKFFRIGLKTLAAIAGILILLLLFINLPFSKKFVTRQVNGLFTKLELPLHIHTLKAVGIRSVKVEGFSITHPRGDTIIYAGKVKSKYHLLALTRSKVKLSDTFISQASVKIRSNEETGKLTITEAFASGKKKKPVDPEKKKSNWEISIQKGDLSDIHFLLEDPVSGLHILQDVARLQVKKFLLPLQDRSLTAHRLELDQCTGNIILTPGQSVPKDKQAKKGPPWNYGVQNLLVNDLDFLFQKTGDSLMLNVLLEKGIIKTRLLNFPEKIIDVEEISLEGAHTGFYTGQANTKKEDKPADQEFLWDIRTRKLNLSHVDFSLEGFGFEDLDLKLRDLQMSRSKAGLDLKKLSLNLSNGFSLKKMQAELDSDSESTLMELDLETDNSQFSMEFEARETFFALLKDPAQITDAELRIDPSRVSLLDVYAFNPGLKEVPVFSTLEKAAVDLNVLMDKKENRYTLSELSISQGQNFNMSMNGFAENPFDSAEVSGEMDLEVFEINIPWMKELLALTGFQTGIPDSSVLSVKAKITHAFTSPDLDLILKLNQGLLEAEGLLDYSKKSYDLDMRFSQLELGEILADSLLGTFSGFMELEGSGFSPETFSSDLSLLIDSLSYKDYPYTQTSISGTIRPGYYRAELLANDPSIHGNLNMSLLQADSLLEAKATGTLFAQLDHLNYFQDTLAVESKLTASFLKNRESIESHIFLDDVKITSPREYAELNQFNASFLTDSQKTTLTGESDFFITDVQVGIPVAEIEKLGQGYGDYLRTFVDPEDSISETRLTNLPEVRASGRIDYHNSLGIFIDNSLLQFKKLEYSLNHQALENNLRYHIQGRDLAYASAMFGKLDLILVDSAGAMDLYLQADSSSLFSDPVNTIKLKTQFARRRSLSEFTVLDTLGEATYNFDLSTEIDSNWMVLKIPSRKFLINKQSWEMESDDLLKIDLLTRTLYPSLNMHMDSSSLSVRHHLEEGLNIYAADLNQVDLSSILPYDLLPGEPGGVISGSLDYEMSEKDRNKISTDLNLTKVRFSDLVYEQVQLNGFYAFGHSGGYHVDLTARLDSARIELEGAKTDSLNNDLRGEFVYVPLNTLQPFTEEHVSDLTGYISGDLHISRSKSGRQMGGQLLFFDAGVRVNTINSSYKIPDQSINFSNKQLVFNEFMVTDSLGKSLVLDGVLDFGDDKPVTADLQILSSKLQIMNTAEEDNNSFYGRIFVDSEFSVQGPVTKPTVDGRILLSNNTEVFYKQRDKLRITDSERIVSFVSQSEAAQESIQPPLSSQNAFIESSIKTIVEIDPSTVLNFSLSKRIYDIALKIQGGGLLNYNMLNNNQISLSGSFEIGNGSADLKLVGWPDKSFRITEGGFVRWDGRVEDPQLDLEAVNTVSTNYVNPVDGKNREVDFNVLLKLSNHLSDLDVLLTISTPDQYLMSIINTMSPEEQMRQAFTILLFEIIDMPGISSSNDYVTQQVNQIVASQLNQLTAATIQGIEISFGLDTYNQNQGSHKSSTSLSYEVKKSLLRDRAEIEVSGRLHDVNEQPGAQDVSLTNVSFAYRLDSTGTKYLKVYNEHTYEDVFEGEVIKTGVGFTYRKRYKTFRDIWRRKDKNKKSDRQSK